MIRTACVFVLVAAGFLVMPAAIGLGLLTVAGGAALYRRHGADRLAGAVLVLGAIGAAAVVVEFIIDCLR